MAIFDLAYGDFGRNLTVLRPGQELLFGGQLRFDSNSNDTQMFSHDTVLIKRYKQNTQKEQGVEHLFPAYAMFRVGTDIEPRDLILTDKETFIVREVSIRHENIAGAVGSEPAYIYCELDFYLDERLTTELNNILLDHLGQPLTDNNNDPLEDNRGD